MNRLITRPWFGPALGTLCYLAGFNDELLHLIGDGWLRLGRWTQTAIVVVVLALVVAFVVDRQRERRAAYLAAVRAARPRSITPSATPSNVSPEDPR